ncbi:Twitching mobility protein [Aquisphaera giovannonii]|uniref:Twitching mobility protein n=1 Tax=Aquisphaera giovannonii TaxID=406548 RepID=A0A5B9WEM7_9BACT|nr:PilT/PilU family type 4a pilus ATPase [Aquisphaera giovannonii]QEH38699.1 Twitching mobility protein [Aquisphaera giovannonii]
MWTMEKILKGARKYGASDVHLIRGLSPAFRVNGEIRLIEGEPLDEASLREMTNGLMNERQRAIFDREWQLCFSRYWDGVGRCRASIYLHAGIPEMAIRLCETTVRGREVLGLPPVIDELARLPNGLILVTGATGNGKTTTLNYLVDTINRGRRAKIITIEDPVEYVHENRNSIVVQQEVLTDVPSFQKALTHVLRQDPDVVVIGEMRDLETVSTALTAAETGHLVLATLHTPDVVQTIQRIFSVFPHEQQNNIMYQLANTLQAVLAQRLLPRADGKGLVLACEIGIATPAVRKRIREGEPHLLFSEMQMGRKHQMQTIDMALLDLYQRGEISYDTALSNAHEPGTIRERSAGASSRGRGLRGEDENAG